MNNFFISMERLQKSYFNIKKKVIGNNFEMYITFHLGYLKTKKQLLSRSDGVQLGKVCPNCLFQLYFLLLIEYNGLL